LIDGARDNPVDEVNHFPDVAASLSEANAASQAIGT